MARKDLNLVLVIVVTLTAACGKDSPTGPSGLPPAPVIQSTVSIPPGQSAVINFTADRAGSVASRIDWTGTSPRMSVVLFRGRCTVEQVVAFVTGCTGSGAVATSDYISKPVVLMPVLEPGDYTLVIRSYIPTVETVSYRLEGSVSGASNPSTSAVFAAAASTQQARFYFPVSSQPEWEWYRSSTSTNLLEYTWHVELQNGSDKYQVGAFLFRFGSAQPRQGSLENLLQAMQHSVFLVTPMRGTLVRDAPVSVSHEGPFVVVSIDDARTMALVLSQRPSYAAFRIIMPGQLEISRTIGVLYGS